MQQGAFGRGLLQCGRDARTSGARRNARPSGMPARPLSEISGPGRRGVFRPKSRVSPRCVTAGRTLERRHCLPGLHQHRVEVTAASALPSDLHRQLDDRGGDLRQCLNALCPELAGADAASPSLYIRKRGEGELAVKAAFTDVILFRAAVMFGPDDAFLTTILELLRRLPIYPMFGRGRTRLQPAYVEDVAEAIARALQRTQTHAITFECGGPRVYSYEELLRALARKADLKRILIPLPFAAWWALAWTAELLPNPPVTRNQVELMQVHNVCSPGVPGFAELGISPHSVENMLERTLRSR